MVKLDKIERDLRRMLVCTFGYFEVEEEIVKRCLEAIQKKDMNCLKRAVCVYCIGDGSVFEMNAGMVCLILYRYGIWQYVKRKMSED